MTAKQGSAGTQKRLNDHPVAAFDDDGGCNREHHESLRCEAAGRRHAKARRRQDQMRLTRRRRCPLSRTAGTIDARQPPRYVPSRATSTGNGAPALGVVGVRRPARAEVEPAEREKRADDMAATIPSHRAAAADLPSERDRPPTPRRRAGSPAGRGPRCREAYGRGPSAPRVFQRALPQRPR